jgi:hypothetical protein
VGYAIGLREQGGQDPKLRFSEPEGSNPLFETRRHLTSQVQKQATEQYFREGQIRHARPHGAQIRLHHLEWAICIVILLITNHLMHYSLASEYPLRK